MVNFLLGLETLNMGYFSGLEVCESKTYQTKFHGSKIIDTNPKIKRHVDRLNQKCKKYFRHTDGIKIFSAYRVWAKNVSKKTVRKPYTKHNWYMD